MGVVLPSSVGNRSVCLCHQQMEPAPCPEMTSLNYASERAVTRMAVWKNDSVKSWMYGSMKCGTITVWSMTV